MIDGVRKFAPPTMLGAHCANRVDSVLDVGIGIRPADLLTTRLHVGIEAYLPYVNRLRQGGFTGPVLNGPAQELMPLLRSDSFDAVLLIDVIEHLPKDEGRELLTESHRLGKAVFVFTPDGPLTQKYAPGERDAWGFDGGYWQTHRSAWTPADFPDAEVYRQPDFHETPTGSVGAFWAVTA